MGRAEVKAPGVKEKSRAKGRGAEAKGSGDIEVKIWVEQRPRVGRRGSGLTVTHRDKGNPGLDTVCPVGRNWNDELGRTLIPASGWELGLRLVHCSPGDSWAARGGGSSREIQTQTIALPSLAGQRGSVWVEP